MKFHPNNWTTRGYISTLILALTLGISAPLVAQSTNQDKSDLEALFFKRVQESKMRFVQADVDFMTHMIPHHSQALIMSRLAPENNAGTQVQKLAARIINAQADEIRTMQTWLRDRGQPVPIVHIDGLNMTIEMEMPKEPMAHGSEHGAMDHDSMDHSKHVDATKKSDHSMHQKSTDKAASSHEGHDMAGNESSKKSEMDHSDMDHGSMDHSTMDHSTMMGMLTQEQLEHLASVKGVEFDKAFLTYMIGHHEGAVYMVNEMFAADGAGNDEDAYRLAADIYAEQVTEIAMMKLMLQEIDATAEAMSPHNSHHNH